MNPYVYGIKNKRGFTLLELICALAVSSVLVCVIATLFSQTILVSKRLESADALFLDGTFAMDYMEREIKAAQEIYGPDAIKVSMEGTVPIGFVLKMNETKYITYGQMTSTIRRYTAKSEDGFQGINANRGVNVLSHHISAISSYLDTEAGILDVKISLEQSGQTRQYHRMIALPEYNQ